MGTNVALHPSSALARHLRRNPCSKQTVKLDDARNRNGSRQIERHVLIHYAHLIRLTLHEQSHDRVAPTMGARLPVQEREKRVPRLA